jgi:CxxC-x17-CxxC domain-containing protein
VSSFSDKVLVCRDCNQEFVFSAGEQEFYGTRGFSEPTRCPDCRAARKASRNAAGGGYDSSSSYGGSSSYGSGSGGYGGARSGGARQMFKVICADCGQETEVPFEPRSGRPVYCRDCFERRSGRR